MTDPSWISGSHACLYSTFAIISCVLSLCLSLSCGVLLSLRVRFPSKYAVIILIVHPCVLVLCTREAIACFLQINVRLHTRPDHCWFLVLPLVFLSHFPESSVRPRSRLLRCPRPGGRRRTSRAVGGGAFSRGRGGGSRLGAAGGVLVPARLAVAAAVSGRPEGEPLGMAGGGASLGAAGGSSCGDVEILDS